MPRKTSLQHPKTCVENGYFSTGAEEEAGAGVRWVGTISPSPP